MNFKKIYIILGIAVFLYIGFRFLFPIVLPFVVAGLVGLFLYPFIKKRFGETCLWKEKVRSPFFVIVVLVFYGCVVLLLGFLFAYLLRQIDSCALNIPFYQAKCMWGLKKCCCIVDKWFHLNDGDVYGYLLKSVKGIDGSGQAMVMSKLTGYSVRAMGNTFQVLFQVIVTVISTVFIFQEYVDIREWLLQTSWGGKLVSGIRTLKEAAKCYIKAQGIIFLVNACVCIGAFFLIQKPYYVLWGLGAAFVDALPVFGIGIVMIPTAIILFVSRSFWKGMVVLAAYLLCVCLRQIIEPRVMGSKIGLSPLVTIFCMYVGFRLFGFFGFFLGPVGVLIGRELYRGLTCKYES